MYASPVELAERLPAGSALPLNPEGLLRQAEGLVKWYTSGAVYSTTREGLPYDPAIRAALKGATLAQAEFWALNGLDPVAGGLAEADARVVSAKTIRGASISYDTGAAREASAARAAALTTLCQPALTILAGAGLLTAAVL